MLLTYAYGIKLGMSHTKNEVDSPWVIRAFANVFGTLITVHRQAILMVVVESGTRKFRCLSVECLFVESGTYDVICQFRTFKGLVVESEVLKAQSAL